MQFVIDIPEGVDVIVERNKPNEVISEILWQAVKNGTPLPERHGRLIDADEVISEEIDLMKYSEDPKYLEYVIAAMKFAPTIIESYSKTECAKS